ncbi:MAG: isoprenoid biosynthesis glyoxalase ElbB [Bdellovibrionota bacterium]
MKKIAVILSGSGHKDGSEITEAVSTLIALRQNDAEPFCFAPNIDVEEINHLTGKPTGQKRNVLAEAARIARGQVQDLNSLVAKDFDGIIFIGGYGAAKNLSDWASKGAKATVNTDAERVIKSFYELSRPIGAICIAPHLVAKVLGSSHVELTIGNDKETAQEIEKTGAQHVECPVTDYITDRQHKVVTTPAYMYNTTPDKVFQGISGLVKEIVEMA